MKKELRELAVNDTIELPYGIVIIKGLHTYTYQSPRMKLTGLSLEHVLTFIADSQGCEQKVCQELQISPNHISTSGEERKLTYQLGKQCIVTCEFYQIPTSANKQTLGGRGYVR